MKIFQNFDFDFLVITNPDGYKYTWESKVFLFSLNILARLMIFIDRPTDYGEKIFV